MLGDLSRMPHGCCRASRPLGGGWGRTAAALGAAAEMAIDPAGRPPPLRLDGGADILIAQHIARTDDHSVVLAGERRSPLCLATARGVVRKLMDNRL